MEASLSLNFSTFGVWRKQSVCPVKLANGDGMGGVEIA